MDLSQLALQHATRASHDDAAEEAVVCTVASALSGEVVATLSVCAGEAVGEIAERVRKLMSPRESAFDDIESYALTFDGVPIVDEKCVLMLDGAALED